MKIGERDQEAEEGAVAEGKGMAAAGEWPVAGEWEGWMVAGEWDGWTVAGEWAG